MTSEQLAALAGTILSLAFAYVPKLSVWYDALASADKVRVMGVALVVTALAVFGVSCAGIAAVGVTCSQSGALALVNILIAALVANQGTFLLLVNPHKQALKR